MLFAASLAILATLQGVSGLVSTSRDVYTIRITNAAKTNWRPAVGDIELYSDTRCTERITTYDSYDTVAIAGSKFDDGTTWSGVTSAATQGIGLSFDNDPSTKFRPNCYPCDPGVVEIDVMFTKFEPVACVKAPFLGFEGNPNLKHAWTGGINVYEKKIGSTEFTLLLKPHSPVIPKAAYSSSSASVMDSANTVNLDSVLLSEQAVLAARGADWENWYGENCRGYLPLFGKERAADEYCSCWSWKTDGNNKCAKLVCSAEPEYQGVAPVDGSVALAQRLRGTQHCENRWAAEAALTTCAENPSKTLWLEQDTQPDSQLAGLYIRIDALETDDHNHHPTDMQYGEWGARLFLLWEQKHMKITPSKHFYRQLEGAHIFRLNPDSGKWEFKSNLESTIVLAEIPNLSGSIPAGGRKGDGDFPRAGSFEFNDKSVSMSITFPCHDKVVAAAGSSAPTVDIPKDLPCTLVSTDGGQTYSCTHNNDVYEFSASSTCADPSASSSAIVSVNKDMILKYPSKWPHCDNIDCPAPQIPYKQIPDMALGGFNDVKVRYDAAIGSSDGSKSGNFIYFNRDITVDDCVRICEKDSDCKSIDYYKNVPGFAKKACDISYDSRTTQPGAFGATVKYDHYEKPWRIGQEL